MDDFRIPAERNPKATESNSKLCPFEPSAAASASSVLGKMSSVITKRSRKLAASGEPPSIPEKLSFGSERSSSQFPLLPPARLSLHSLLRVGLLRLISFEIHVVEADIRPLFSVWWIER